VVSLLLHQQLQQPVHQLVVQIVYLQQQHSIRFHREIHWKYFLFTQKGSTSIIQKPKESSDPMDQLLPAKLNDLVDIFM